MTQVNPYYVILYFYSIKPHCWIKIWKFLFKSMVFLKCCRIFIFNDKFILQIYLLLFQSKYPYTCLVFSSLNYRWEKVMNIISPNPRHFEKKYDFYLPAQVHKEFRHIILISLWNDSYMIAKIENDGKMRLWNTNAPDHGQIQRWSWSQGQIFWCQ